MAASYMQADKTCDKVDAQIWVVYNAFRDEFMHPFIKYDPPIRGTNRELCSCPIWEKLTCRAGPANQNQAFFPPEQK